MKSFSDYQHIQTFKNKAPVSKSSVTLAGTGPNTAVQVPVLRLLNDDYLRQIKSLNVISGSVLAFFTYIVNEEKGVNLKKFQQYEHYVRRLHTISAQQRIARWLSGNHIFDNKLIGKTVHYLFGLEFCNRKLKDVPYPVNFYSYCIKNKRFETLNSQTYPEMTLKDVGQACMSVPYFHGKYDYNGNQFIDPIFSGSYNLLRNELFKQENNTLYVNHKKSQESGNVYFLTPLKYRFPEVQMKIDFLKFYFGITNQKILKTNARIIQEGIIHSSHS